MKDQPHVLTNAGSTWTRNGSLPLILLLVSAPGAVLAQKSGVNPPRAPGSGAGAPIVSGAPTKPVTAPASSNLAGLLGSTLSWQYFAYGGAYDDASDFVANGAVGGTFQSYFNIIGSQNSVTFNYAVPGAQPGTWSPSSLSLPPTIYNGIAINLISGPSFVAVMIDPETNMVGFDSSRISFTANQIQVDWQNLAYTPTTIVKLDIITPGATLCRQDQYGNQYNFTFDSTLDYVYGTVTNAQGCSSTTWNLIGSFAQTASGFGLTLTAGNPTPGGCQALYSLSGIYPNFEWLYSTGEDNPQNSTYVACGTLPSPTVGGKGALK